MNIQIFGTKKCNDTKKAERFFKERGIKFQFIDMKEKGMSKGEFTSVAQANGGLENMINWECKDKDMLALIKYIANEDKLEKVLENPQVIKTPVSEMESSLRSDISRIYGRIRNDFMNQNETQWDKLLKIKTTGRDDSRSDQYRYPYEPTQYCVLERLANNGLITKKNVLLDYGTGKGRVCFYLSYQTRCRSIGVEYDERIFESAEANREHAVSGRKVSFELTSAEKYTVPSEVDRCYFFNPFSVEILRKVLAGIYESYYEKPREILLMFYYPSEEYLGCLMTEEQLMFYDEINTEDLFEGKNDREKILIFSVD